MLRCIAQVIISTRKWYIIEDSGTGRCKVVTYKVLREFLNGNKDKFTGVKFINNKIVITDDTDIIQMDEWLDKRAILFICDNSAYVMYGEHKPGIFEIPLIGDNGFIYNSIENASIYINGKLKDKCSLRDITQVNMYGNNDKLKMELGTITVLSDTSDKESSEVNVPDTSDKESSEVNVPDTPEKENSEVNVPDTPEKENSEVNVPDTSDKESSEVNVPDTLEKEVTKEEEEVNQEEEVTKEEEEVNQEKEVIAVVSTPDTPEKEVNQEENQIIMEELDLVSTEKEYTNKHNDFSEKLQSGYYSTVDFSKVDFSLFSDDELKQLIDGGDKVFISIKAKAKLVYEDRHTLTDEEEESQFVKFAVESGFIQQNEIPDNYIIPPSTGSIPSEAKDVDSTKISLLEKAEERGIVIPGEIICYHWKIWNVNMCQKMSKICCIYILYMLHFIWDIIHHCLQAAYYQNYHYYQNYQHAILPYADI